MAPRKGKEKKEEQVISLGPQVAEGENVFGVCHIFASFNDTFVHVTDLSGKETICRVTGGMKVKADRDESSPYAAMLAAQDVAQRCKELGITALHIKLRATGGNRWGTSTEAEGFFVYVQVHKFVIFLLRMFMLELFVTLVIYRPEHWHWPPPYRTCQWCNVLWASWLVSCALLQNKLKVVHQQQKFPQMTR